MTSCRVFIATSLDGFIADPSGSIHWLTDWPDPGHDYGYGSFIGAVDGLVMGRGTFEKVLGFETWPYDKPVIVLSRTLDDSHIPSALAGRVRISRDTPEAVLREVETAGWRTAYVDGGKVIQSFLAAGLINELTITRLPILLGAGYPLFGSLPHPLRLKHIKTTPFASGFVQSHYTLEPAT